MASEGTADGRAMVTHHTRASPSQVWAELSDGWLYSSWVVGTSRIRAVDAGWPAVGSRIHHSAGVWPFVVDDATVVLEANLGHRLVLQAKGWPAGEARAEVTLTQGPGHDLGYTVITIIEDAVKGPGMLIPKALRQATMAWRNGEALRRLAFIAEGRPQP